MVVYWSRIKRGTAFLQQCVAAYRLCFTSCGCGSLCKSARTAQIAYDTRRALTELVNKRGERRSFEYDRRGRLRSLTHNARRFNVERDERGRIRQITGEHHKPAF